LFLTSFSSLSSFSRTCLQPPKQLLSNHVKSKRDLRACNPMAEQKSLRLWGACLGTEEPNVRASQGHEKKILSIHVSSHHTNARRRAMLRALPDINGGSGLRYVLLGSLCEQRFSWKCAITLNPNPLVSSLWLLFRAIQSQAWRI
jgi:hypothetical protein